MKLYNCLIFLCLLLISSSLYSEKPEKKIIQVGDSERFYYVVTPGKKSDKPLPLVIVLHGGGGSALKIMGKLGFTELAEKEKFILVFPNALVKNWNDGRKGIKSFHEGKKIEDVAFLKALIKKIKTDYPVNPEAVFMMGVSNGGMMTFRMTCENSTELAAVATVIANMPETIYKKMKSKTASIPPLPLLMINGTDDPLVLWDGGSVSLGKRDIDRGKVVSVDDTVKFWIKVNKCKEKPLITMFPDKDKNDGVTVRKLIYPATVGNADVVQYILKGGGHTWPGRKMKGGRFKQRFYKKLLGNTCMDIDPAAIIWNFFKRNIKKNSSKLKEN